MDFLSEIRFMLSFLNGAEKRFLYRHIRSSAGEKSYSLEIWDAIGDQNLDSEKALKERFAHVGNWYKSREKFVDYLLTGLGHLNRLHLPMQILNREFQDLMALHYLGGYSTAYKKCNKLEEKCKQQEAFFLLDPLLNLKREIALVQTPLSEQSRLVEEIAAQRRENGAILYHLEQLKALQLQLWNLLRSDTVSHQSTKQRARELLQASELPFSPEFLAKSKTLFFYHTLVRATFAFYLREDNVAIEQAKVAVDFYYQNYRLLIGSFSVILHFFIITCRVFFWIEVNNEKTISWILEFKAHSEKIPMAPANRHFLLQTIHHNLLASYSTPPHHINRLEELEELMSVFDQNRSVEVTDMLPQVYINVALIYTMNRQPGKALPYLEKILSTRHNDLRIDAFVFANLLRVLLAIQEGNSHFLENTYRSVSRYLRTTDYLPKTQEAVLALGRQCMRAETAQETRQALAHFRKCVEDLEKDPQEHIALSYIGFYFFVDQELDAWAD